MTELQIDHAWSEFRAVVADKFGTQIDRVQREASFVTDLGADSLDMIQVLMEFEDRYGVAIPQSEAAHLVTVGDAFAYVVARVPS